MATTYVKKSHSVVAYKGKKCATIVLFDGQELKFNSPLEAYDSFALAQRLVMQMVRTDSGAKSDADSLAHEFGQQMIKNLRRNVRAEKKRLGLA